MELLKVLCLLAVAMGMGMFIMYILASSKIRDLEAELWNRVKAHNLSAEQIGQLMRMCAHWHFCPHHGPWDAESVRLDLCNKCMETSCMSGNCHCDVCQSEGGLGCL